MIKTKKLEENNFEIKILYVNRLPLKSHLKGCQNISLSTFQTASSCLQAVCSAAAEAGESTIYLVFHLPQDS